MADIMPTWVWDLVADLLDEEDVHPTLHAEMFVPAAGKHQMVRYDWCPAKPLARVPGDVKAAARIIAGYRRVPAASDVPAGETTPEEQA